MKNARKISANCLLNGLKTIKFPLKISTDNNPVIAEETTRVIAEAMKKNKNEDNQAAKNFSNLDAGSVINCKLFEYVPISENDNEAKTSPVMKNATTPRELKIDIQLSFCVLSKLINEIKMINPPMDINAINQFLIFNMYCLFNNRPNRCRLKNSVFILTSFELHC